MNKANPGRLRAAKQYGWPILKHAGFIYKEKY